MNPATPGGPRIPVATYRLQFNSSFRFSDARAVVDYLHALGISDAYASSYLCAVPGSSHGYDVADPTRLNPELGTDAEYRAWIGALQAKGMGHVLDLVPNHMGIARSANPWWMDVLENGPASRYAQYFDITWRPLKDELADRVLIPTLGDQYGAVLDRKELQLAYRDGAFVVCYFDDWFPLAPDTFGAILSPTLDGWVAAEGSSLEATDADELRSIITAAGHLPPRTDSDSDAIATRAREKEIVKRRLATLVDRCPTLRDRIETTLAWFNGVEGQPRSFDPLDALLDRQSYRLAHWRTASEEINYRRFFDVNQLAALRMEDPDVFAEVHRFAFDLIGAGAATGLRVDHVDGLFAPGDYLRRLQGRAAQALGLAEQTAAPLYVVVEKILGPDERLPADWPVHGTTGYEFAAAVNGLFVDRANERALTRVYERFLGGGHRRPSFEDLAYACKKSIMHETMSGDINSLGYQLNRFSERNRHFRDFTLYSLISTIKEVIACFPVYRTYITDTGPLTEHDRRYVARAIRSARKRSTRLSGLVFDFVERMLLHEAGTGTSEENDARQRFIGKFQQITSPVAAKGIEDTALYIDNRLISLNEVGADPTVFGTEPGALHAWMGDRRARWPTALSATGTHDTKRGEDVRARIGAISELPGDWKTAVGRWRALNRRLKREVSGNVAPDANEEYFLYQTLVGTWPAQGDADDDYRRRLTEYMVKALREAKVHTSWLTPDEEYERAVLAFVDAVLARHAFLDAFRPFQRRVAEVGMVNGLAQLLIKCTAPGVPDFYQGTELWDLAFVDPDNRRPVDYASRASLLTEVTRDAPSVALADRLVADRHDGRIKLFTTARALAARHALRHTFEIGEYVPLRATGAMADHVFAFARVTAGALTVTCVPRLVVSLPNRCAQPPLGADCWTDTALALPSSAGAAAFEHAFTGEVLTPVVEAGGEPRLYVADLLGHFPVALLTSRTGHQP
ncbi:MAG TPA: malto-oligosyltrehalose synthase [Vicinamibacterales bacterium]|nr:malto-oligosyltrehalose synthase [Vicinamibacterales bacterium]